MAETQTNSFLEKESLGKLMGKYAVPCVISLLVAALYNIVDQIFIANASYLGSYGNAANTVVFPLTVVTLSIAVMIGDGCCAFVSICLGANKKEDASRSIGSAVLLCILSSIALTAVFLLFMEPILTLFGGKVNEETYACAQEYFFWITLGIPFYMFGQAVNPIIRSDGSPKFAMFSTLIGAIANMILDPIFIFPLRMGMMGAAVATVIGQILTAGLSAWYLCHMKAVQLKKASFTLWANLIRRFLSLVITSFLSQISLVISMAAVQNMCTNLATVNKGTFIYLQALGKAVASTLVSLTREVIFGVALPVILPIFLGLDGLLYSFPAADILTFFIALHFIRQTYRELDARPTVNTLKEAN